MTINFNKLSGTVLLALLLQSCMVNQRAISNRKSIDPTTAALRDSIIQKGLEGEALYTLMADIKPMSSVATFAFPLSNSDSTKRLEASLVHKDSLYYLDRVRQIQEALNCIDLPDLKFVLVPYRNMYSKPRILQISVLRISKLDSLLVAKQDFFGQYGFSAGADPAVVVTVNEYEKKYERLRGYGYLFGYPDYAVDFFVKAFHQSDSTGQHVNRKFFRIPTFEREQGNFVYAYPVDHVPAAIDSTLYKRSLPVLAQYKQIRDNYMNADSTIRGYALLQDWITRKGD
ncbi:hypothetical protein FAZ15_20015 [Sphingobacterium olei]|uniref:Lipoprotein n=1 Tax=Sphingobacterium olei TaxID=2571155 RepID=A0A4U0ND09_9SPHI|nr:hypothetical protein [Sphingobacterium olei]TJZ51836.1 hypothetical protein FAZ15_20015 [Sphingobacterium olei]